MKVEATEEKLTLLAVWIDRPLDPHPVPGVLLGITLVEKITNTHGCQLVPRAVVSTGRGLFVDLVDLELVRARTQ